MSDTSQGNQSISSAYAEHSNEDYCTDAAVEQNSARMLLGTWKVSLNPHANFLLDTFLKSAFL